MLLKAGHDVDERLEEGERLPLAALPLRDVQLLAAVRVLLVLHAQHVDQVARVEVDLPFQLEAGHLGALRQPDRPGRLQNATLHLVEATVGRKKRSLLATVKMKKSYIFSFSFVKKPSFINYSCDQKD